MRKLTIAELRRRELAKLVAFKTESPTDEDFREARKLMNSFYRLCGLAETNLYLSNEERTCNLKSTKRSEEREHAWWERLDKMFHELYGLNLVYCGYAPSIVKVTPGHGVSEKIQRHFYQ